MAALTSGSPVYLRPTGASAMPRISMTSAGAPYAHYANSFFALKNWDFCRKVTFLDGIKDLAISDVNAVLHGDIEDDQQQEPDRGDPRDAVSSFAPESAA